jgi:hypothetical protein
MQKAYVNGASPTLWAVLPGPEWTILRLSEEAQPRYWSEKLKLCLQLTSLPRTLVELKSFSGWLPVDVGLLIDADYLAVAFSGHFGYLWLALMRKPE